MNDNSFAKAHVSYLGFSFTKVVFRMISACFVCFTYSLDVDILSDDV